MLRGVLHVMSGIVCLSLAGGCSLILDFDDPVAQSDAPRVPDAAIDGPPGDAAPLICTLFEPNDTPAAAAVLTAATYQVGLCPAATDIDYYRIDLSAGSDNIRLAVTADLGVTGAVVLLDETGMSTVATGEDPEADLSYAIDVELAPGVYLLRISAPDQAATDQPYSLGLETTVVPPPGDGGMTARLPACPEASGPTPNGAEMARFSGISPGRGSTAHSVLQTQVNT